MVRKLHVNNQVYLWIQIICEDGTNNIAEADNTETTLSLQSKMVNELHKE